MHYVIFESLEIADMYLALTNDPTIRIQPDFPSGYVIREQDICEMQQINMAYNGTTPS